MVREQIFENFHRGHFHGGATAVTHCNSLQLSATHCNTLLQHCNSLQLTAIHCTHCNTLLAHCKTGYFHEGATAETG